MNRRRLTCLWLVPVCAFWGLSACGTLTKMEIDKTDTEARRYARDGDLRAEVDSMAHPVVDRGEVPGLVVGVLLPDGSRHVFGYGLTEIPGGVQPEADTLFAVGSLTKGFVGTLAAILVQEGVFSWEDTLGALLPDQPLSPDAKKITLVQLATHRSGLPNQPQNFQTFRYVVQYLFTGKTFYRHLNQPYVLAFLSRFKAPATSGMAYSSLGYAVLGYVIEQRTGSTVQSLLEKKLLQPLGLQETRFDPEALPGYARRARGYAGDHPLFVRHGRPVPDWTFTEFMKGTGGLYSTANDLLTFAAAHLQRAPEPLGAAMADTLMVRAPRAKDAPAIAWFVDTMEGLPITYQVGVVGGYTSYIGLDLDQKTAVVVLENSFRWTNRIGHKLLIRLHRAHAFAEQANAHR